MLSPSLHSQLAYAQLDTRHRAARAFSRGQDLDRPRTAPLSTLLARAIKRLFDGGPAMSDEAAAIHGFGLVGDSAPRA